MPYFTPGGGFSAAPDPGSWANNNAAIANFRGAASLASLMLWPEAGQMGVFTDPPSGDGRIYEKLADLATTTRASKAWHPNWDFVSGSVVGPLIEFANNVPVIGPGGLLVFPQIENLFTNPRAEGAALPAAPTNWTTAGGTGGTISFVGRGSQNGWPYLDVQVNGTISSAVTLAMGASSPASVTSGDSVTCTIGVQRVSGTLAGNPTLAVVRDGGLWVANAVIAIDRQHRRFAQAATVPSGATGAYASLYFPTGTYANAVIRVSAPCLTKTTYPTVPVLPTAGSPGASVKQLDLCSIAIGDWYRHEEGAMVVEFIQPSRRPTQPNGNNGLGLIRIGTSGTEHRGIEFVDSTGALRGYSRSSTTLAYSSAFTALAVGARGIAALSWSAAGVYAALNGSATALFGAAAVPSTPTVLQLGYGASAGSALLTPSLSPILRARYFPRAMSAEELAEITAPYWS